jgi:hypothetical protein
MELQTDPLAGSPRGVRDEYGRSADYPSVLFGGGGFYVGGPLVGGGLGTLILLVLIVMVVTGRV